MDVVGIFLKIMGGFVTVANAIWLSARLVHPRDMTRLGAVSVFLPGLLIGLVIFYTGRRLERDLR